MDISQLRLGSFSELELRVMLESVLAIKRLKEEIQEEEKKRRKGNLLNILCLFLFIEFLNVYCSF